MSDPYRHLPADPAPTLAYLTLAEHWLRRQVYYLHDRDNARIGRPLDEWRTLLPEILRRLERLSEGVLPIGDDCDAWSMTAIDIARWAGVPMNDCYLALVASPLAQIQGQKMDHMIGAVSIDGDLYVVGDTFRAGPYPIEQCMHRIWRTHALPLADYDWRSGALED